MIEKDYKFNASAWQLVACCNMFLISKIFSTIIIRLCCYNLFCLKNCCISCAHSLASTPPCISVLG